MLEFTQISSLGRLVMEHKCHEIWEPGAVGDCWGFIESGIKPNQIECNRHYSIKVENMVVWDKNTGLPIYNAIVWAITSTLHRLSGT